MPHAARAPSLFLWYFLYRYLYLGDAQFLSRPGYRGLWTVYSVPPDKCSYITSRADQSYFSFNTDSDSSVRCHISIPTDIQNNPNAKILMIKSSLELYSIINSFAFSIPSKPGSIIKGFRYKWYLNVCVVRNRTIDAVVNCTKINVNPIHEVKPIVIIICSLFCFISFNLCLGLIISH